MVLLLIGLIIHYFFFTVLVVKGRSMEPNLHDGQILGINKISYRFRDPERGEPIAMFFPGETERKFIKRIIGLPGEKIEIKDGSIYINGEKSFEGYLDPAVTTNPNLERTLQSSEYFVLGDNRTVSSDSRAWGPVPRSFIIGRIAADLNLKPLSNQGAAHRRNQFRDRPGEVINVFEVLLGRVRVFLETDKPIGPSQDRLGVVKTLSPS